MTALPLSEVKAHSLEATLELISDPVAIERIRQADAAIAKRNLTSGDDMAELMGARRQRERRDG